MKKLFKKFFGWLFKKKENDEDENLKPVKPPVEVREPHIPVPMDGVPRTIDDIYFDNYAPDDLQERYMRMYHEQTEKFIGKQLKGHIDWNVNILRKNQSRYMEEVEKINSKLGLPEGTIRWEVLGVLHGLEGSYDFNKQILNGQPYWQRTTWVPRNLGPFETWADACAKAFEIKRLPERWTVPNTLYFMLTFNGLGYLNRGLYSPYLWSYTNYYADQGGGKYVSDGKFSSSAISLQVGAAVLLKRLNY